MPLLKAAMTLILLAVVSVAGLIIWLTQYPDSAWHAAQRWLLPPEVKISSKTVNLGLKRKTWRNWQLDIHSTGLNVVYEKLTFFAPALDARIGFTFWPITAESFVTIQGGELAGLTADRISNIRAQIETPSLELNARFSATGQLTLPALSNDLRTRLERTCRCRVPQSSTINVIGNISPRRLLANLSAPEIHNSLFDLALAADIRIERENSGLATEQKLKGQMRIRQVKELHKLLVGTGLWIPAPLTVLDGEIQILANSPITRGADGWWQIPLQATIGLGSTSQRVDGRIQTVLRFSPDFSRAKIHLQVLADDVVLDLPPIDPIMRLPRLRPDPRIIRSPTSDRKKIDSPGLPVSFDIEVKTERPGAVKFASKFAKPNIPLSLQVRYSPPGSQAGFIQVEPFQINYLRRQVRVERIKIDLNDTGNYPINGKLLVNQTDYKITISIQGTTKAPHFTFNSDPYLPRSEIISVLLYDRTSEKLTAVDAETLGSFEAALADRAIGLFGLWAFATTPIRSFSYNPTTKIYSATVLLGKGVTAGVGTNWERSTYLEVRKHISKRWILSAALGPNSEQQNVGELVLQWEHRF